MGDLIAHLRALSRYKHDDLSVAEEAADEIERLRAERDLWESRCLAALWLVPDERTCGELQDAAKRAKALLGMRTTEQDAALQELVDQAQELDMGYGQLTRKDEK